MSTSMRSYLGKLGLACAFSCLGLTASPWAISDAQAAKLPLEDTTLVVGFSLYPPFVALEGDVTTVTGIDVDIVYELQRRTGFKIKGGSVNLMSFHELLTVSQQGKVDIIGGGVSTNEERDKRYMHAGPTYISRTAVVVSSDSKIKGENDLKGKQIAGEMGTVLDVDLPDGATLDSTKTNFLCFYRVANKMSDALITDEPVAHDYLDNLAHAPLKIAYVVEGSETPLGLLFKRENPASEILLKTFDEMVEDGTVEKIVHGYSNICSNPAHVKYYQDRGLEVDKSKVRLPVKKGAENLVAVSEVKSNQALPVDEESQAKIKAIQEAEAKAKQAADKAVTEAN